VRLYLLVERAGRESTRDLQSFSGDAFPIEREVEVCGAHSSKTGDEWGNLALEKRTRNKIQEWAGARR
jgi:hypothetical protein